MRTIFNEKLISIYDLMNPVGRTGSDIKIIKNDC